LVVTTPLNDPVAWARPDGAAAIAIAAARSRIGVAVEILIRRQYTKP
jgi:hypothetical protein